jgi:hypothetical protein
VASGSDVIDGGGEEPCERQLEAAGEGGDLAEIEDLRVAAHNSEIEPVVAGVVL